MQFQHLTTTAVITQVAVLHPQTEVVTAPPDDPQAVAQRHRCGYEALERRSRRLAQALLASGLRPGGPDACGDVLATMAWNNHRHMECWFGMMGCGFVCHTLNPRLFEEQLVYIADHAEDKAIFYDGDLSPIIDGFVPKLKQPPLRVVLTAGSVPPGGSTAHTHDFEDLVAGWQDAGFAFAWPSVAETTPCGLCFTSGTTGNPKGVLYTHRSNILHAMACVMPDQLNIGANDSVLPVVPLFHANAWSLTFAAPIAGCRLVLPHRHLDGRSLHSLMNDEGVTFTAGVPTVWLGLLDYLRGEQLTLPALKTAVVGGAACPAAIFDEFQQRHGVEVVHAWGMTELSPMGTVSRLNAAARALPPAEQEATRRKQGRAFYGLEMRIVDDDGTELPRDGVAFGRLQVRGHAVVAAYWKGDGGKVLDEDGFFDTGDVATIDPLGYMAITDRSKDVIKSGGEWISSIEVENALVGLPGVRECACVRVESRKWTERPMLLVVRAEGPEGAAVDSAAVRAYLKGKLAAWWVPELVEFLPDLPHTATGKLDKKVLRAQFADVVVEDRVKSTAAPPRSKL